MAKHDTHETHKVTVHHDKGTHHGVEPVTAPKPPGPTGASHEECKYHSGDKVKYKSGACCYVQHHNDDGTYSVMTDDNKHCFNAKEDELELANVPPKPRRKPRG